MRALIVCLAAAALFPATAAAEPDRTGTVSTSAPEFKWDGAMATGANTARDPATCSHTPDSYCDQTLIEVQGPADAMGTLKVTTDGYFGPQCTPLDGQPAPCDFSLWLYASDASGKPGRVVGSSVNDSGEPEEINLRTAQLSGLASAPAVTAPAPSATPAAPLGATLDLAGPASARRGIPVVVGCSAECRGTVVAELSARDARRLGLGRRTLVIARSAIAASPTRGRRARLQVAARVARRLARAKRVRVTLRLVVTDASGTQRANDTLSIALRA